jgi:hypothetical protein
MSATDSYEVPIRDLRKLHASLGDMTISRAGRSVMIAYDCEDCHYSFEHAVHLGRLLSALGLTAADCERAIAEWGATLDVPAPCDRIGPSTDRCMADAPEAPAEAPPPGLFHAPPAW